MAELPHSIHRKLLGNPLPLVAFSVLPSMFTMTLAVFFLQNSIAALGLGILSIIALGSFYIHDRQKILQFTQDRILLFPPFPLQKALSIPKTEVIEFASFQEERDSTFKGQETFLQIKLKSSSSTILMDLKKHFEISENSVIIPGNVLSSEVDEIIATSINYHRTVGSQF